MAPALRILVRVATKELALAILPQREAASFDALMAEHQRLVVGTAYRLLGRMEDAQDAAQEVFLRLLKNLHKIDGDAKPWLYRVTVNICHDHYRRRVTTPDYRTILEIRDTAPTADRVLEMDDRKRLLMEGLQILGERERASVVLRDIEGLATSEVAQILGVEEVTVRSAISTARVKLAKYVRNRS